MKIIWKDIDGFDGLYQVNNLGDVKSLRSGKMLKQQDNGLGYLFHRLSKCNIVSKEYVHRIVAKAFIGNPDDKIQINHKNGIKSDNRMANLEWCTPSENHKHAFRNGMKKPIRKKILQFSLPGKFINEFRSGYEAMYLTGVSNTSISGVCNNRNKSAGGFIWKFKN